MIDIDVLNNNPEMSSFYVILITVLFAFFLSSLIAITYQYTTKSIYRKAHFLQSIALIGMVAATVMQAIGDSVARGLGILGALSIIRFRTVLDDPRNITFMFASLAAGIACGVLGYSIALTGTLVFCLAAVILRFSPMSNSTELIGELRFRVPKDDAVREVIEHQLKLHCKDFELDRMRFLSPKRLTLADEEDAKDEDLTMETLQEFTYLIRVRRSVKITDLTTSLKEIEGLEGLRLNFKKQSTKL